MSDNRLFVGNRRLGGRRPLAYPFLVRGSNLHFIDPCSIDVRDDRVPIRLCPVWFRVRCVATEIAGVFDAKLDLPRRDVRPRIDRWTLDSDLQQDHANLRRTPGPAQAGFPVVRPRRLQRSLHQSRHYPRYRRLRLSSRYTRISSRGHRRRQTACLTARSPPQWRN